MSWKHKEPLEEEAADNLAPILANLIVNGSREAGEAPPRRIFGFTLLVERHISVRRNTRRCLSNSKSSPSDISGKIRGVWRAAYPQNRELDLAQLIKVVSYIHVLQHPPELRYVPHPV